VSVAAVVLAAGAGARWNGPGHKLTVAFRGRPLAAWAVDAAMSAGADETIVVTGAVDLGGIVPAGCTTVHNPAWADGQATSLQAAVAHARRARHEAVVGGRADAPLVGAGAWRAVAERSDDLVCATFDGRRRPPVRIGAALWDELPTEGDEGARGLLARRASWVVEVACDGHPADIDTVEDLRQWS